MGDTNPIRTHRDHSRCSHEGYRNTIELPEGNNVVPLRSDTIRLVQHGCSFHELRCEDLNQHLKDFLNFLDSFDLDDASPHWRILLLVSLLNSFHQEELQNSVTTSLCSNNIKESLFLKHGIVLRTYSKKSLIMASTFGSKSKSFMTMLISPQDEPLTNRPVDFAKPVKAISLPQDVPSTSDRRLIELKNQVQCLLKAHLAPKQLIQVNKITSSLVSNFMTSQDARLSKFKADFKQKQSQMTNKIDTVLKAITDRMVGVLPSDTVKNPELNFNPTSLVFKKVFQRDKPSQKDRPQPVTEIRTQQPEEPEQTLEDKFKDLHLNLSVLEVLTHALMYNANLDKYIESLELGKNGSAFVQGEVSVKMEDPGLFTLPCRFGDSKPFDTLADLGSCVNIIPLYLFKKLNIKLLEETNHIFRLADGTKSYPVGIVKDVEVHIGRLKLLNDFYVIDMKKDLETPLLVGRRFLATANAVIDCRKAKIAVEEGINRSVSD
ncbi:MAK10-like protein [Tanacetum coccineum]